MFNRLNATGFLCAGIAALACTVVSADALAGVTCQTISYEPTIPVRRGESTISAQRSALSGLYQRAAWRGFSRNRLLNVSVRCRYVAWEGEWRGVRCLAKARVCSLDPGTRPRRYRGTVLPLRRR